MKRLLSPLAFALRQRLFVPVALTTALLAPVAALAQTKPATPAKTTTPPASKDTSAAKPKPAAKPAPKQSGTISESVLAPVERDLRVLGGWVNETVNRADATIKRELPQLKADFDRQSSRIDRAADSLSNQSKREYDVLKRRYNSWETEQERLDGQARRPETAQSAQTRLLGENVNLARARPTELHDLYGRFIDAARAQRKEWTSDDWAAASAVLTRLNQRYEQVREQVDLEERLRIRSWQGEFRTFEKARATKDAMAN
ncbi:hypothetical protein [Hymenobacter koreensis]|uniref:Chromosome partition protein Smc n=1 Tax=Hymenobacter koreensis TaxID=1084523 RepID=A0ABP8IUF3_9BACT